MYLKTRLGMNIFLPTTAMETLSKILDIIASRAASKYEAIAKALDDSGVKTVDQLALLPSAELEHLGISDSLLSKIQQVGSE